MKVTPVVKENSRLRKMYLDNRSQDAKIRQRILDVLQVNLTSPEGASTLLPAGVLGTDLLGEPLRVANLILTEKSKYSH